MFGLEQLLHGHGLVEMVFGLGDLFTSDQEPHVGVDQILRSSAPGRAIEQLCGRQALLGSFFTDGQRRFIVASAMCGTRKQRRGQRCVGVAWLSVVNDSSTRLAL